MKVLEKKAHNGGEFRIYCKKDNQLVLYRIHFFGICHFCDFVDGLNNPLEPALFILNFIITLFTGEIL